MITRSFDRALGRLITAFTRHQDVPRTAHNIAELGTARWDLERARGTMAIERERVIERQPVDQSSFRRAAMTDDAYARLRVLGSGLSQ